MILEYDENLIKKIWYDPTKGQIFIHTNCRSGLFHIPVQGGEKMSYWLVDIEQTESLPETETIYRLMDVEKPKEEKS